MSGQTGLFLQLRQGAAGDLPQNYRVIYIGINDNHVKYAFLSLNHCQKKNQNTG